MVSIGSQENETYLSRGTRFLRALRLKNRWHEVTRTDVMPITLGFRLGLAFVASVNIPLPTRIVAHALEPIDIAAEFGEGPDV